MEQQNSPDVVWAPEGLDRIHVPTGTRWVITDKEVIMWRFKEGHCAITRDDGLKEWHWQTRVENTPVTGKAPTEGDAMFAALDASSFWKKPNK